MTVDLRRLALVLALLAAAVAAVYGFVVPDAPNGEDGFADARIVDPPPAAAAPVKVGLRDGEQAPDFEISTPDGARVRLSDLRGQPVVLSFFALWCGGCLAEMPVLKEAQAQRGLDRLSVLAVNTGETRDRALEFIDVIDAPFTWTLDFDLTVTDAYGVHGLPHTVFIDANGIVRTTYTGVTNRSRLNTYLDAAFAAAEAAPAPDEIKFVTPIPRDHTLHVTPGAGGELLLASRRLRCDAAYCADSLTTALRGTAGVLEVTSAAGPTPAEPALTVRYDPALTSADALVALTVVHLEGLLDPLFRNTPLVVRPTS